MTKKLRRLFPRLLGNQYRITSNKTRRYNCIAWAAGGTDEWWQAPPDGYWPGAFPDDGTVESLIRLFESLGFTRTEDRTFEPGMTKIAIFADAGGWTHAARQLPDGRGWTSKIGALQDIEHDTLESLTGDNYGQVVQILKCEQGRLTELSTP